LRLEERNEDDSQPKRLLEDMVKEMVPVGIDVELANQPDWKSSSPTMVTEYTLKIAALGFGSREAGFACRSELFSAPEKGVFENAGRTHPAYFHYPYQKVDDITIDLPLGWKLGSLAKPLDQDAKAAPM